MHAMQTQTQTQTQTQHGLRVLVEGKMIHLLQQLQQ